MPGIETKEYTLMMNESVIRLFEEAMWSSLKNPLKAYYLWKALRGQKKAAWKRLKAEAAGLHVPPAIMISITERCNIRCQGCFLMGRHHLPRTEMDEGKLKRIFTEAEELGISLILLMGGEPLVRQEILNVAGDFPDILFPLFTNGLLIDGGVLQKLKGLKNVIPILSMDGFRQDTDGRRGEGVYDRLRNVIAHLQKGGLLWGVSFMMTGKNFEVVTSLPFLKDWAASGCKVFFFVEYNPTKEGPEEWILTRDDRVKVMQAIEALPLQIPGSFIAFPGDEGKFGGCLSAGRGFVHISPDGDVEPCPFLPFSDVNLNESSLAEALQSQFFNILRRSQNELESMEGGCPLQARGDWVGSLLPQKAANL